MNESEVGRKPPHHQNAFLLISNTSLILFAAGFIWISLAFYSEKEAEISLSESRFITTEWNLMQTLKVNTDRQLMDKEREILALRKRYLQLVQNPNSSQGLAELRSQLHVAETERQDILSLRLEAPGQTDPVTIEASAVPAPTQPQATLSSSASTIFQSRIRMLESQLSDEKALSLAISTTLASLNKAGELAAQAYREELAHKDATIARLSQAGRSAIEATRRDSQNLEFQRHELKLDLSTKVLLRALASSPEIRDRYPDLLGSLDGYLEQLALVERLRGRSEAYAVTSSLLEPLEKALNNR